MLTHDRLKQVLFYDKETGNFFWKIDIGRRIKAGMAAGTIRPNGRMQVRVDGKLYLFNRLAWFYMHGHWPIGEVDHINGNPLDDSINNLRDIPRKKNLLNKNSSHSKSGLIGGKIAKSGSGGKYFKASIYINGRYKHIGYYKTAEEAHRAYLAAKKIFHDTWSELNMPKGSENLDISFPANFNKRFIEYVKKEKPNEY